MTNKQFILAFAARIKQPAVTRSSQHIIDIVLHGKTIPVEKMFSDINIERLYSGMNVYQDVYKYVRDNQKEFLT